MISRHVFGKDAGRSGEMLVWMYRLSMPTAAAPWISAVPSFPIIKQLSGRSPYFFSSCWKVNGPVFLAPPASEEKEDAVEKRGQAQLVQLRHREGRLGVGQQVYALSSGSQGAQHFSRLGVQPDVTKGQGAKEQSGIATRSGLADTPLRAYKLSKTCRISGSICSLGTPGRRAAQRSISPATAS